MEMEIDSNSPINQQQVFKAAETGNVSLFNSLPQNDVVKYLSFLNDDSRSLLHVAVSSSHPLVVKILAEADATKKVINAKDEDGWTPLHSAVSIGNFDIVHTLIHHGADVNLKNDGGRTPLHYAASKGWVKLAELLLLHGADINAKDKVGCTPLHRAASTGNSELCEFLIEEGAEIDALDRADQTPLMHAVICENKEVALLLIRHGADVDVEDKEGYTVLGRASDGFRDAIIDAAKAMMEG